MNASIQATLDFSIFILQFNFFNGFAFSERYAFSKNAHFASTPVIVIRPGLDATTVGPIAIEASVHG